MKKGAGLLLPLSSLPGKEGIGSFGEQAYRFIDFLSSSGFSYWQILPLNPLGEGNSPYMSLSSFAFDPIYIDLKKAGEYLGLEIKQTVHFSGKEVEFKRVRRFKENFLRYAFSKKKTESLEEVTSFAKKNKEIEEYAILSSFLSLYGQDYRSKKKKMMDENSWNKKEKEEVQFALFCQYLCSIQYEELHSYAKEKGIEIIGDLPFYVGVISAETFFHEEEFLLQEGKPTFIAGVPPDYFSPEGQNWGNPIYDYEAMRKNGFSFLKRRIESALSRYDYLRIDHFRAFDTYWAIPAGKKAKDGEWKLGVGKEFFDLMFAKHSSYQSRIIAEDLGELRPEVLELRDAYNFPGMDVIQFTFFEAEKLHFPAWNKENEVAYLMTHDNEASKSWFYSLPIEKQGECIYRLGKLGINEGKATERLIAYCLQKKARIAILTSIDILDEERRINVPGSPKGNWGYRLSSLAGLKKKKDWLKRMIKESKR